MFSICIEARRLFKSSKATLHRSESSEFTTPIKRPPKPKHKSAARRPFVTLPPVSPNSLNSPISSALYDVDNRNGSAQGGSSEEDGGRRRPGTFPFLFVMMGIAVLFAAHLPIGFYVVLLIVVSSFLLFHLLGVLTGLSSRFSRFIQRNADSAATAIVIIGFIGVIITLSGFFTVNCAVEVTRAATDLYSFVNMQIDNQEVRDYIQSLGIQDDVNQALDKVYAWSNNTFSPAVLRYVKAFNTSSGTPLRLPSAEC